MRDILAFIFILLLVTQPAYAEKGWFPYWFPEDPSKAPDYMGLPASTFNAGKDVLDPPAGKHGFVKVKDGHFYFEDGTRARFWGTNLCFGACFPEHKVAEIMANRIAYFGFNAVRLHHMDMLLEPDGIFESPGKLSPRQLDKLDYLIFQLKQRGIYVDINTLVSRFFKESEGVIDAEKLGMAAKPASLFDARLIELQKQYDKDLLTHLNPYTKLRYCDDPAVCLVEITNENTLIEYDTASLPKYYQDEINKLTKNGKISLSKIEKKYMTNMHAYLRHAIGIKVPISIGGACNPTQWELEQECLDYVDIHGYWDHPRFPHKQWDVNDFFMHNKPMSTNSNPGIIGEFKKYSPKNIPYVISEWNHCYPNPYAYETPVLLASIARQEDWDALFQFDFAQGWQSRSNFDNISNYFDINSNAQQLILCSYGSKIFVKNKDAYIPKVGQIKNTNSGWDKSGRFNWGTGPTLLKQP